MQNNIGHNFGEFAPNFFGFATNGGGFVLSNKCVITPLDDCPGLCFSRFQASKDGYAT